MSERTQRQKDADQALDAAIRETNAAYYETEHDDETTSNYVIEWLVTGTAVGVDVDGQFSRTFVMLPEGGDSIPHPHVLGMVHALRLKAEGGWGEP